MWKYLSRKSEENKLIQTGFFGNNFYVQVLNVVFFMYKVKYTMLKSYYLK